ncbi:MAG: YqeG family HAD IIIA-type phosphatase [Clostridium sp.]|nr:YqeG family HAD IIIA-type phosphatase [Clostridium sp.]
MLDRFYPDEDVDSVYGIDFEKRKEQGVAGVLFDIDNTLVPHGAPADARAKELFAELKRLGIQVVFLSNNKEPRVKLFRDGVGYGTYIYKAGKPNPKNYRKAMQRMHTDETNTLLIGDQLFTDVWGAKRAGIPAILVKPIHPKEEIQIVLKRRLEAVVLFFYRRKKAGRK